MRPAPLLALALAVAACGGTATATPTAAPATARPAASSVVAAPPTLPAPSLAPRPDCPAQGTGPATKATITLERGGAIVAALRADKAPKTVANFVEKSRACFYDGLTFHRVEPGFVIQGGDPKGNGTGGNNTLPTEPSDLPFDVGALGIARGGDPKISNDAQFFVCIGSCRFLDGLYTNFGKVTGGQDVANGVKIGDRIKSIRVE